MSNTTNLKKTVSYWLYKEGEPGEAIEKGYINRANYEKFWEYFWGIIGATSGIGTVFAVSGGDISFGGIMLGSISAISILLGISSKIKRDKILRFLPLEIDPLQLKKEILNNIKNSDKNLKAYFSDYLPKIEEITNLQITVLREARKLDKALKIRKKDGRFEFLTKQIANAKAAEENLKQKGITSKLDDLQKTQKACEEELAQLEQAQERLWRLKQFLRQTDSSLRILDDKIVFSSTLNLDETKKDVDRILGELSKDIKNFEEEYEKLFSSNINELPEDTP